MERTDNGTIKKILEIDIKVQTDTGKEKVIRISDIVDCYNAIITSSREDRDYSFLNDINVKIEFNCSDYVMELVHL